ncbi:hypothetical protein WPS_20600 [Vulcanimicrobium alpinum]|uniref:Major facilitator superfamily (MFS) profile domain-containing protein n=1 Tax=Vulcanimicrobium alpinum TaxID=3016050 RepID=A0AAN1XWS6_UNVUL|nr:hypothetical protein WPS_20600 [Vulcanimicrobium alpinum]
MQITFVNQLAGVALTSTYVLYTMYRYGWDARVVGLSLAFVGICSVATGPLTHPIIARIGERRALFIGLCCGAASMACYGLGATGPLFSLGTPILAFWGLSGAASQAFTTRRVAPSEQGQLQGAIASIRGLAMLFRLGLFTSVFAASIATSHGWQIPGAAWLLAAALLACSIARAAIGTRPRHAEPVEA